MPYSVWYNQQFILCGPICGYDNNVLQILMNAILTMEDVITCVETLEAHLSVHVTHPTY